MGNWVDFKEARNIAPFPAVLRHYGVELRYVNGDHLRGRCPLPMHRSTESKESFTVNLGKNIWSCKSSSCVEASGRRGGNILDFVMLMEQCKLQEAAGKLMQWFGNSNETAKAAPAAPIAKPAPAAEPPATATPSGDGNQPLGFELKGIAYHPYLEQRGISTDLAVQYGVGYFPGKGSMAGRVVIPIRDESARLVAYAGRAIDDSEPKYKLPPGFQKSKVLFNRHAATADTVVVVEGFFDCLKVSGAGFPCVALMGCSLSDEQEALLESRNVILMLDGDAPGRAAQAELTMRLAATRFVRTVRLPDGKQPDMLTPTEIAAILTPLLR